MLAVFMAIVPGLPMLPFLTLAAITGLLAYQSASTACRVAAPKPPPAAARAGDAAGSQRRQPGSHRRRRASGGQTGNPAHAGRPANRTGLRPGQPGRHAQGRRFAGTRHRRAQNFRAGNGRDHPAHPAARQSAIGAQRIPLSAQGQSHRAGRIDARPLAGHERLQQQDRAQRHADRRAGLQAARHLDHRCRAQKRRNQRATPWWTPPSVLVTHLSETVKRNCHEILSRQDVQSAARQSQADPSHRRERIDSRAAQRRPGAAHSAKPAGRGHLHPQPGRHSGKSRATTPPSPKTRTNFPNTPAARWARKSSSRSRRDNGSLRAITLDPQLEQQIAQGVRQSPTEIA